MNAQNSSFYRKVGYLVAMALLLVPLSWLSQPATSAAVEEGGSEGGKLAQLRTENGLSQANLGEIDPTSEALKLATLGMRGVAANVLWEKARHYQKTEDWTNLTATLEQITHLQPNFISVWRFQAWNLAYNVSVEWDDYHDRYYWIKRGIKFLENGIDKNRTETRLHWDRGWFTGNKIGRADEYMLYRQLFKEDEEMYGNRPVDERDNWLVAKEYFEIPINMVDTQGVPLRGMNPLLFFSEPNKCQMRYAMAIEEEGRFGEYAQRQWKIALDEWTDKFGQRVFPTMEGKQIRMLDKEDFQAEIAKWQEELDALVPGLRRKTFDENLANLSEPERALFDKDPFDRTPEEEDVFVALHERVGVNDDELVQILPEDKQAAGQELLAKIKATQELIKPIEQARTILNFDYWLLRCQVEITQTALQARELLYQAAQAYDQGQLENAEDLYVESFTKWRELYDKYPELLDDGELSLEVYEQVRRYREVLRRKDIPELPDDFPLQPYMQYLQS